MNKLTLYKSTLTLISMLAAAMTTQAAVVTLTNITDYNGNFQTPAGDLVIAGDSDVSTLGTLVSALNFGSVGSGTTTVNGVAFQNIASPGAGSGLGIVTTFIAFAGSDQLAGTGLGSGVAPYANLSAGYQALLNEATGRSNTLGSFLNFGGLTSGHEYQFQFWVSDANLNNGNYGDSRVFFNGNGSTTMSWMDGGEFTTPSNSNLQVSFNNTATAGGLGSYVIGTFTEDGSGVSIKIAGDSRINAVQVRDITAIPEPATYALIAGMAVLGLILIRRKVQD